ncbi:MAG: hypothetical protein GF364_07350 [Candidatus Lokiarchaeota archaeon]|nr:hypothetical protein [Candidatus Lokiarchaeota archaeon]
MNQILRSIDLLVDEINGKDQKEEFPKLMSREEIINLQMILIKSMIILA